MQHIRTKFAVSISQNIYKSNFMFGLSKISTNSETFTEKLVTQMLDLRNTITMHNIEKTIKTNTSVE